MKKSFCEYLSEIHAKLESLQEGNVADYIPELAKVFPDSFGIALVTVEGHVHQVGDSIQPFSIQSISKAFTYGLALEDSGVEAVKAKIDVEPSGEAFNSISLEPETGRPRNPLINAGAIVATSLVNGEDGESRINRIVNTFSQLAARKLRINDDIYSSERSTGHRNRAISHLLRNYDILEGDPEDTLNAYFKQCSIMVTAQDLALMGATLANKGINPITNVQVIRSDIVPHMLAVMTSCGMYDYSGNWINSVGLPAKSGVGGGIMAVLPGQFGLAVFSPRLDDKGNSVRGIKVCETVSKDYSLHMLNSARLTTNNTVRALYTVSDIPSCYERIPEEAKMLSVEGNKVLICELAGEQSFVTSEALSSELLKEMEDRNFLILDFERMTGIDQGSSKIMAMLMRQLDQEGKTVLISGSQDKYTFRKYLRQRSIRENLVNVIEVAELDSALQYCEECLLESRFTVTSDERRLSLNEQPLFKSLEESQLSWIDSIIERRTFAPGEKICSTGDPSEAVFIVEKGKIDVMLVRRRALMGITKNKPFRVASYSGGAVFGEAAFFEKAARSADVIATSPTDMLLLRPDMLNDEGTEEHMAARQLIYKNLAEVVFTRLRSANKTLLALTG